MFHGLFRRREPLHVEAPAQVASVEQKKCADIDADDDQRGQQQKA